MKAIAPRPGAVGLVACRLAPDLAASGQTTLDQLQIVVLREVQDKAVSHGLNFVQAAIDENRFLAFVVARTDVRLIAHPLLRTKSR